MKLRPDSIPLALSFLLLFMVGGMAAWVVGDFSGPLSDGGDTDFYEYVGYYFAHNLYLWPVPQLDLVHNQTFYPYGADHTLLDWGWERDYWYRLGYWLFGSGKPGPYLQYYYVYSLLVSALGTFWLLHKPFGPARAFVAGLVVSVFNFYCLYKYPVHLNISVMHWTTLSIVGTYRLLYELVTKPAAVPAPAYWLLWGWLHVQVLSQELGYVAGFALTFTMCCLPFIGWYGWQRWQETGGLLWTRVKRYRPAPIDWLLLLLLLVSLWLYLPLTIQIFLGAQSYADAPVPMKPIWSHPLRLLIPYLPGIDSAPYKFYLNDWFESYGQGSPGLYLLLLGALGWWAVRRQPALWLPIVVMLVLCLLYHPVRFPTLQVFPWFSFNRHGGRATLVYPVLLVLLALWVPRPRQRTGKITAGILWLLMLAEWSWGFRYPLYYHPTPLPASVAPYMRTVRETPGEAVLDFPFCTIGADGVGAAEGLCPYYLRQNAVFSFRRFHQKKVVGQYWGRLHPRYVQPFLTDNWPRLLQPGYVFTPADWRFLTHFLRQHQFAGINLYPDLVSPAQRQGFYQHFGKPIARTYLPMAGPVEFLSLLP